MEGWEPHGVQKKGIDRDQEGHRVTYNWLFVYGSGDGYTCFQLCGLTFFFLPVFNKHPLFTLIW